MKTDRRKTGDLKGGKRTLYHGTEQEGFRERRGGKTTPIARRPMTKEKMAGL